MNAQNPKIEISSRVIMKTNGKSISIVKHWQGDYIIKNKL